MLDALITWSLRHRVIVLALSAMVAVTGAFSLSRLPVDAFPDTTPVQVQINTSAPSLGPTEVEQQITAPVERAISGLAGLTEVRSLSKFGLSQVTAIFDDHTPVYLARQLINERLGTVEIPEGIETPDMGPVATGLGEVLHYVVTSPTRSLSELRSIHDWIIRPRLASVEGVAEVNSWGGLERQFQVVVDPSRLLKYRLSLGDLLEALRRNNANVGGGQITRAGESILVQGIGRVSTPEEVGGIVVTARDGVPIHVRDVGDVVDGHEIRRGAVTYDGTGEAVLGLGFMRMGENTRDVTTRLKDRLEEIKATLPADVNVTTVYDRTHLVDRVLRTVKVSLFEGAVLVVVVLFVFLGDVRAGLIVGLAIPLSMLFAGNLMLQVGIAGSLMSLGAIDFGLIVDSSVIMVENSVRRLAERGEGASALEVVREAALEVRRPTLFGELIILIVYLPVLTLEGMEGKMFAPMAWTVVFALAGSMVFSLTLMPVLASYGLGRRRTHSEPQLIAALKRAYRPVVEGVLARRKWVLVGAGGLLVAGGATAWTLGATFIPRLSEEAIVVNTVRLAGVSVEESVRYGVMIEKLLLEKFPDEIEHIWSRTGTAEVATDPMGLEVSDVFLTLYPREKWTKAGNQEELVLGMQGELSVMPGMRTIFAQPIELRVNEMVAGIRSDLGVKLFGDDFELMRGTAEKIEKLLKSIPGAADTVVEQVTGQPVLEIKLRQDQLARHGVSAGEVLEFIEAIGNIRVGEIQQGETRFPLTVRLPEGFRSDPERVATMSIPTASGQVLPLSLLADVKIAKGPSTINREWGRRRVVVQSNVRGRDVASFVAEARKRIASEIEPTLPAGSFVTYGGQFEHLERGSRRLMFVVPLALGLVFFLLYVTYGRVTDVLRIFSTLPLAAVGGIAALKIRDLPFSISAGVGFVAMCGVSVLGDMVFVSHLRTLLSAGRGLREAIVETAQSRLRPVLMTGLVASLGFVPMALNTGVGAEVQRPLATVVIGSVVTSTALTLLVLPVLYSYFGGRRSRT